MGWTDIFSSGVDKVVDSVAKGVDELFTSDEERLKAKRLLEEVKLNAKLRDKELDIKFDTMAQSNVTDRWKIDSQGNFLTKSVRPLVLIYWTIAITILMLSDGNIVWNDYSFMIRERWIDLIEILTVAVYGAFFIGKSIERVKGNVL